jgi:class 3 adenylate cyclase
MHYFGCGALSAAKGSAVEPRTFPLPDDLVLASWAQALNDAGHWAYVFDARWRLVFVTDESVRSEGDAGATTWPIGHQWFGAEVIQHLVTYAGTSPAYMRENFREMAPYMLAVYSGDRDALRRHVDPDLWDLVDALQPLDLPQVHSSLSGTMTFGGAVAGASSTWFRIANDDGDFAGAALLMKPAVGMSELAAAAATADQGHLERMRIVQRPDRRPAAILMADLEASSPLARRLSTAQYFAFGRRWVRMTDRCVIDQGGLVGRHAGDGIVAFFLAETAGSESAAARSCIIAARVLRSALVEVAARSEISEGDVSLRFGLHWGATLYVGRILTAGRSEVTALGDEVNETARIEACATGGRTLASKSLVERLNTTHAAALGIDVTHASYTPLAELATATDKARRDAGSIAVCDITDHAL